MFEWPEKANALIIKALDTPEKWKECLSSAVLVLRDKLKEFIFFIAENPSVTLVVVSASFTNIISSCLSTILGKPLSSFPNILIFSNALCETSLPKPQNYKILNVVLTTKKSHVNSQKSGLRAD